MRRYVQVSGVLFGLIAAVQLMRTALGWPARVGEIDIPVWWSAIAFLVTSTFAFWAWRTDQERRLTLAEGVSTRGAVHPIGPVALAHPAGHVYGWSWEAL